MRRFLVVFATFYAQLAYSSCLLPNPSTILETDDARVLSYEMDTASFLFDEVRPHAGYLAWVSAHVDPDPVALILRQSKLSLYPHHRLKNEMIARGDVGKIGGIKCLEAKLFEMHHNLRPLDVAQSEFEAVILTKETKLRVYVHSSKTAAPSPIDNIVLSLPEDVANGWIVFAHVHNHSFFFANPTGDIAGTVVPSGSNVESYADIAYYKRFANKYGLDEIWITNGISTFRAKLEELAKLP